METISADARLSLVQMSKAEGNLALESCRNIDDFCVSRHLKRSGRPSCEYRSQRRQTEIDTTWVTRLAGSCQTIHGEEVRLHERVAGNLL